MFNNKIVTKDAKLSGKIDISLCHILTVGLLKKPRLFHMTLKSLYAANILLFHKCGSSSVVLLCIVLYIFGVCSKHFGISYNSFFYILKFI
jgi:hypothetical protein